jgi:hypothetical protein
VLLLLLSYLVHLLLLLCKQAGRDPPGYRDSEIFRACQKGMENLRSQMREARQAGERTGWLA